MISIDTGSCVGCGLCAKACPMGVIRNKDGQTTVRADRKCIACYHCMAVCPRQAVHDEALRPAQEYIPFSDAGSPLLRVIRSRRSIRHYRPEAPSREVLQAALDGAGYAPSGKNVRDNRWAVVRGKELCDRMYERIVDGCQKAGVYPELAQMRERGVNLITCGAPCLIIGYNKKVTLNPEADTVIAMATLELLLAEAGVGTCWGGYLRDGVNTCPEIAAELGISEDMHAFAALMVGYPDGEQYRTAPYRKAMDTVWIEEARA